MKGYVEKKFSIGLLVSTFTLLIVKEEGIRNNPRFLKISFSIVHICDVSTYHHVENHNLTGINWFVEPYKHDLRLQVPYAGNQTLS